jgi:hypothetical protein
LAHSLIPHHHHSEFQQNTQLCELENHTEQTCKYEHHNLDSEQVTASCCVDHHQHNQAHTVCTFTEKIILTKGINLSNLFLPPTEIDYLELVQNEQSLVDTYIPIHKQDPHTQDLQLRGPPLFS